jgi:asparagine synthase (glutamine-hydrolysing)
VTTCSIGFTEQEYDEAADAKVFAASLQADHHDEIVTPETVGIVSKLAWHYDEPFADSSAVPTYYVSKIARRHVTVALSGDGGDENFAGYRRYHYEMVENRVRSLFPAAVRRNVFGPLARWYPKAIWAPRIFRAKSTFQFLSRSPLEGYFNMISSCPMELKQKLLGGDVLRRLNGYDSIDVLRYHHDRADAPDPLSRIQYVDMKTYLTDDILVKVDRASMANSLEVRCPLLDHSLMELAAEIPSDLKLNHGRGKYIFKQALRPILPESILHRRKAGFAVPVAKWFRDELKEFARETLLGNRDEYLDYDFVAGCWKQHQSGRRDWSSLLWTVLMFKVWQGVFRTT